MKKILLIEDDKTLREEISDLLKFENYDVLVADNGKSGLLKAITCVPDLILCDIMMPEMDGLEVLSKVKTNNSTRLIPFIFLTALADRHEVRTGMQTGADDYLTKPFSTKELLMIISKCFEKTIFITEMVEQELSDLRNNIITQLPHELRTPLNGIIGLGEYLAENSEGLKPSDIKEIGDNLLISGNQLNDTINKFLLYIQLEINSATYLSGNIATLPSSVLNETTAMIAKKYNRSADLIVTMDESKSILYSDLFSIAVKEITDNAFKFSETGTPVSVQIITKNSTSELIVHNTGRFFPEGSIPRIGAFMQFERQRFEQAGTGMGLIISKKIVAMLNGTIEINSTSKTGTTVIVTIPLA